jgi:hypothetical protein
MGNATAGAGSIGYSDETGWFNGNYYNYGAQKDESGSITTAGYGLGIGPVIGFFTGPLSGFTGPTDNVTLDIFGYGVSFSKNDSGWGLSYSAGGKGNGLGFYMNTTYTGVWCPKK